MRRTNPGLRSGFTLIELLLVLVILAVLAAVVVPKFTGRSEQAKQAAAKTDISNISMQIAAFEIDTGRFPSTEEALGALMSAPANANGWRGPYLERLPVDPWQNQYQYRYPGQHNTSGFDLFSMGADGREGNDDIDNWSAGAAK